MAIRDRLSAGLTSAGNTVKSASDTVKNVSKNAGNAVKNASENAGNAVKNFIVGEQSAIKTTADVLRKEYKEIWGDVELPQENFEVCYRQNVQRNNQAALCLSGGGIRSAAVSLGVLQGLASRGLLTQFQYLSTVSGGGYTGGWLSRWIATDKADQNAANVETVLRRKTEILEVSSLRANSNYLTPKTGITSADTWTGILLWVRNVLLNWTVFIPALMAAVLAPNLYLAVMTWVAELVAQQRATLFGYDLPVLLLWIGGLSLTVATWQAVTNMPSHRDGDGSSGAAVGWKIVTPLLLWAALVPLVLVAGGYEAPGAMKLQMLGAPEEPILVWVLIFSFGAKIFGYVIAAAVNRRNRNLYFINFLTWVIVSAVATGALWLVIAIIEYLSKQLPAVNSGQTTAIVFALSILGPLGANLAHLLLSTLYVGFRHVGFQDDDDREWLARVSAVSVFPALLWAVFALICLFLPFFNAWLLHSASTWGPGIDWLVKALGVISGFVAVLGGQSAAVKLDMTSAAPKSTSAKAFELVIRLATLFFIVLLFAVLASIERRIAECIISAAQAAYGWGAIAHWVIPHLLVFLIGFVPIYLLWYFMSRKAPAVVVGGVVLFVVLILLGPADTIWAWATSADATILKGHGLLATTLFLIVSITSMKIDVNRFSMHGVYRNRLVRAFLGAARASRKADPFTDFDAADNCRVSELNAKKGDRRVLYHVINVTLNLVGGENLAWQERKASSFVITPLYCGSAALGDEVPGYAKKDNPRRWSGAYIETNDYGGNESDLGGDKTGISKTGISLGTALTISGAAASPSMGYNSSPVTAFLMTLFNVRLGAWLANPAAHIRKDEVKAGPTSALRPLLTEALGLTDARSTNVYLSDGGHFDNLGIYEMIRRRCRYILVVDVGQDETFKFEDLARSVRFAAIDLDAKIEFDSIKMKDVRDATPQSPLFAFGTIKYAESPDNDPSWLVYLKPTFYYEDAPADVRSYWAVNPKFPHESTLDQWFGESQFESYRRLGEYLMSKLPQPPAGAAAGHTLADFFAAVSVAFQEMIAAASRQQATDGGAKVAIDISVAPRQPVETDLSRDPTA